MGLVDTLLTRLRALQSARPQAPSPAGVAAARTGVSDGALGIDGTADFRPVHLVAYVLSVALTFLALFYAVSGAEVVAPASGWIAAVLALNLGVIVYLGVVVWRRIARLLQARRDSAVGARLHIRLVTRFALAAVAPAIVIAVFSALTIDRGVQAWFSSQVRGAIEATSVFGREEIRRSGESVRADAVAMARDLNAAAVQLQRNPGQYRAYLSNQADRRGFVAVYLIDSAGQVTAQASRPTGAPPMVVPDPDDFATARDGTTVDVDIDEGAVVRGLFRLTAYRDTYLMVVRLPEPGQLALLRQASQAVQAYRVVEERRGDLSALFAMAYLETVLLVLIGAAWLGLVSATRISVPIGRLARAAEKVRDGDWSARVEPDSRVEEISALTTTFNTMTSELRSQREALETSREQAEANSAFIRTVLEGVSAGVVSLDRDGAVLAANGSAARLLRVAPDALAREGLTRTAPEFTAVVERARPGAPASAQVERTLGADTVVFDVRAAFAGEELVITFDDVSNLLAAQRQAAWKDVARRIAHEIKNPLTPIQLSAERLRRKYADTLTGDREAFVRMTDTIVRQVSDIGRMVDEFSAFARMPAPRFSVDDLGEVLRQTVFAQRIASPDIDVVSETPPEPVLASMDSRLIAQAFANILKNAAESVALANTQNPGETGAEIRAVMSLEGDRAVISVLDTGVGFPVQDRRRLLEPYVTTRTKGTGLGLAIVVRVLEEHGGSMELADRPDEARGACVRITLPLHLPSMDPRLRGAIKAGARTPATPQIVEGLENANGG